MEPVKVIKQFSIDVDSTLAADTEKELDKIEVGLLLAGFHVRGISWKASWTEEGYEHGRGPFWSD